MKLDSARRGIKPSDRDAFQLLVSVCRSEGAALVDAARIERLADPDYRREFLDLAALHHVLGLALSRLAPSIESLESLSSARSNWQALLRRQRRRAALFEIKREDVVARLGRVGVRAVVLKGAALCCTAYEDPVERDLDDLDLLVARSEVDRAIAVLDEAGYGMPYPPEVIDGYRRHHFHFYLRHADGHVVEVHWALATPASPFQVAPERVLESAVGCRGTRGRAFEGAAAHHLVLQIVLQNLQEGFSRLGRLVDVDRLVRAPAGLDWDALVAATREGGLESAVAVTLQLCRRVLGAPVPREALRALLPGALARFHLAILRPEDCLARQALRGHYAASRLFELWLVRGAGRRLLHLARQLRADGLAVVCDGYVAGPSTRVLRVAKLGTLQLLAYLSLAGGGREGFWSEGAGRPVSGGSG